MAAIMTAGMILTMLMQVGAAGANMYLNSKSAKQAKEMQRKNREAANNRKRRRDIERAFNSRIFQLEMEEQAHLDRMSDLNQELQNSLSRLVHPEALRKGYYPLTISPYILQRPMIPLSGIDKDAYRTDLCLILTNSNSPSFNKQLLPYLDEGLCELISAWNGSTDHPVSYYLDAWNNAHPYCDEDVDNLQALIKTPTLTITPYITVEGAKNILSLKLNLWGVAGNCFSAAIDDVYTFDAYKTNFTQEEIKNITTVILPSLMGLVGTYVDVFYWARYYLAPALPGLLADGFLGLGEDELNSYADSYSEIYKALALGQYSSYASYTDHKALNQMAEFNNYNMPERTILFLGSVLALTKESEVSGQLIDATVSSLYEAWTGLPFLSYDRIDVAKLCRDDVERITELARLAQANGQAKAFKSIKNTLKRDILHW